MGINNRHVFCHRFSGLGQDVRKGLPEPEAYYGFFEEVRKGVPEKDRMDWDMKKHSLKDLCKFLGIKEHVGCDKPTPKVDPLLRLRANPFSFEQTPLYVIYVILHVVNYKMFWGTLRMLVRLLCGLRKTK